MRTDVVTPNHQRAAEAGGAPPPSNFKELLSKKTKRNKKTDTFYPGMSYFFKRDRLLLLAFQSPAGRVAVGYFSKFGVEILRGLPKPRRRRSANSSNYAFAYQLMGFHPSPQHRWSSPGVTLRSVCYTSRKKKQTENTKAEHRWSEVS